MKEKIKNVLFGGFVFYVATIIILMLFSYFNSVTEITLSEQDGNLIQLEQYKQELLNLNNTDCVNLIDEMIDFYENTSYNGMVNLKELFESAVDGPSYLSFYKKIQDNCDLANDEMSDANYPVKFVSVAINTDQLIQDYYYQYELSIKDMFSRNVMDFNLNNIEYHVRKEQELEVIGELIKLEKERNEINE